MISTQIKGNPSNNRKLLGKRPPAPPPGPPTARQRGLASLLTPHTSQPCPPRHGDRPLVFPSAPLRFGQWFSPQGSCLVPGPRADRGVCPYNRAPARVLLTPGPFSPFPFPLSTFQLTPATTTARQRGLASLLTPHPSHLPPHTSHLTTPAPKIDRKPETVLS